MNLCPVDRQRKTKNWHLVCPECWAKVPRVDQELLIQLHKQQPGSETHVMACRRIVRTLCVNERKRKAAA